MQHQSITQLMRKVYLWQKEHQVRWVTRSQGQRRYLKSTDWERGVFWSCVAAAWRETRDEVYLNGLAEYTLNTGFRPGPLLNFADDQVCIQGYLEIYQTLGCDDAIQYAQKALEPMLASGKRGREIWWWADALFMSAPTLAAFAAHSQQPAYWELMDNFWWDAVDFLHDPETGLYYRDKRYIPSPEGEGICERNGEKVFWARGIGWILAAIPRILGCLPEDFPSRERYITQFLLLSEQIVKYQSVDGLWRTSLLDPGHFPEPESSASALFCYALAWGVNQGILGEQYRIAALRAWQGLSECVNGQGKLGWVQLPAYNPRKVDASHNIDYGAGVFLLAGTEMLKLQ